MWIVVSHSPLEGLRPCFSALPRTGALQPLYGGPMASRSHGTLIASKFRYSCRVGNCLRVSCALAWLKVRGRRFVLNSNDCLSFGWHFILFPRRRSADDMSLYFLNEQRSEDIKPLLLINKLVKVRRHINFKICKIYTSRYYNQNLRSFIFRTGIYV